MERHWGKELPGPASQKGLIDVRLEVLGMMKNAGWKNNKKCTTVESIVRTQVWSSSGDIRDGRPALLWAGAADVSKLKENCEIWKCLIFKNCIIKTLVMQVTHLNWDASSRNLNRVLHVEWRECNLFTKMISHLALTGHTPPVDQVPFFAVLVAASFVVAVTRVS